MFTMPKCVLPPPRQLPWLPDWSGWVVEDVAWLLLAPTALVALCWSVGFTWATADLWGLGGPPPSILHRACAMKKLSRVNALTRISSSDSALSSPVSLISSNGRVGGWQKRVTGHSWRVLPFRRHRIKHSCDVIMLCEQDLVNIWCHAWRVVEQTHNLIYLYMATHLQEELSSLGLPWVSSPKPSFYRIVFTEPCRIFGQLVKYVHFMIMLIS